MDIEIARKEFKTQNYIILRKFISQEMVNFLYRYGHMRRKSAMEMIKSNNVDYCSDKDGTFMEKEVPGTYSVYGDPAMETLLELTLPRFNSILDMSLVPTYSYWRMYKTGDKLRKHKDRASCEVSSTLCIGYDNGGKTNYNWPIYMIPSPEADQSGVACRLEPGDLVVYRGCEVEHWREELEGELHMQVFMHFSDAMGAFGAINQYDCRASLGLPASFKDLERQEKVERISKGLKGNYLSRSRPI